MSDVFVYTMDHCPFCDRAKRLLQSKNIQFEEEKVDPGDPQVLKKLEERSGMKTLPQIFIKDKCIGGYQELAALDQDGKLKELLD